MSWYHCTPTFHLLTLDIKKHQNVFVFLEHNNILSIKVIKNFLKALSNCSFSHSKPVCTLSSTCSSDIATNLPSSSLNLTIDGKHARLYSWHSSWFSGGQQHLASQKCQHLYAAWQCWLRHVKSCSDIDIYVLCLTFIEALWSIYNTSYCKNFSCTWGFIVTYPCWISSRTIPAFR